MSSSETLPKILWVSDAAVETGFARVTHNILGWLGSRWQRVVLGVNATGDPHPYPYRIYPARVGGDFWGFGRFADLVKCEQPDVIVVQSDAWIVETFVEIAAQIDKCPPVVGYMPVDAKGMKRSTVATLSNLALAVFYTEFGEEQALDAGFRGRSTSIGLGIRRELYRPMAKEEARRKLLPEIPRGAFVIGNVNRNQPRKRLDLTIACFADWIRGGGDGFLYLHCVNGDAGYDLRELAHYYGVAERLYMPKAETPADLLPESGMPTVYSAFDLQVSTAIGEGFGLCTLEGMACGVPQLVPEWAALAEWPRGAVRYVRAVPGEATIGGRGFGIGAAPDRAELVTAIRELRDDVAQRRALSLAGIEHAAQPRFDWAQIAARFDRELSRVIAERSEREAA